MTTNKTTLSYLRKLTSAWASRLGLAHWDISARWGKASERCPGGIMDDCWGIATWDIENQHLSVIIAPHLALADVEETVVHELLHCRFEGHKPTCNKHDPHYEQGLNKVAAALVTLARANQVAVPDPTQDDANVH